LFCLLYEVINVMLIIAYRVTRRKTVKF
jgi:hypothetical protein